MFGPEGVSKKLLVFSAVSSFFIAGCASNLKPVYYGSDKTQVEVDHDIMECKRLSDASEGGGFVFGPLLFVVPVTLMMAAANDAKTQKYLECMRARGYRIESATAPGAFAGAANAEDASWCSRMSRENVLKGNADDIVKKIRNVQRDCPKRAEELGLEIAPKPSRNTFEEENSPRPPGEMGGRSDS